MTQRKSFMERYRTTLIGGVAVVAVLVVGILAFQTAGASGFVCSVEWQPDPTSEPAPGATQGLGYVQPDQGKSHNVDNPQRYTLCPPASGSHRNISGAGPIQARKYGPDDNAVPMGWIHNLEHGGMVIAYRCRDGDPGCTEAAQAALDNIFANFPNSPICGIAKGGFLGPVIARFDAMAFPYAAIVWNRVLPLQELDAQLIYDFYAQFGEKTAPEAQCPAPTPTPTATPAVTPTPSPTSSASPSATAEPSPSGSAGPSPSGSPEPSSTPAPTPSAT